LERQTSGNQDVVVGIPDDAIRSGAADQNIPPAAADQQIVAAPAEQNIVAAAALEAVVAGVAVEPGGQGDVAGYLNIVVASLGEDEDLPGRVKRAQQNMVDPNIVAARDIPSRNDDVVVACCASYQQSSAIWIAGHRYDVGDGDDNLVFDAGNGAFAIRDR
jgi:hypothetical protein